MRKSTKVGAPQGNFRERMFEHDAGPMVAAFGFGDRFFECMDTPYGLISNIETRFIERIMTGECSIKFLEELAISNLPDMNVSNLVLNMKTYKEERGPWELPKEQRLKYLMEGLISIDNGFDVPLTGLNWGFWWWGLDGSYRRRNKISDSEIVEWKKKWREEYAIKALNLPEPDENKATISLPLNPGREDQESEDEK